MIDSHLHIYSLDQNRYPRKSVSTDPPPEPAEVEDYLKEAKNGFIEKAVLVQPTFYGIDNRYIFDSAEKYPEFFRVIIIADYSGGQSQEEFTRQIERKFVSGARLNLLADNRDKDLIIKDKSIKNLIEKTGDLNKTVEMHVKFKQLDIVKNLAGEFSRVNFVIDHMAYPDSEVPVDTVYRKKMEGFSALSNVYFKLSGYELSSKEEYPFEDVLVFAEFVLKEFGTRRCMWGSNYPYMKNKAGMGDIVSLAKKLIKDRDPKQKKEFLGDTAAKLFF